MSQFNEKHMTETGKELGKGGYPDMGNGLYSLNLSYKEWFSFQLD